MNIEDYENIQFEYSIEKLLKLLEICKDFKEKKKNIKNNREIRYLKKKYANTFDIINKLRSDIIEDQNIDSQERINWLFSNDITLITNDDDLVIDIN